MVSFIEASLQSRQWGRQTCRVLNCDVLHKLAQACQYGYALPCRLCEFKHRKSVFVTQAAIKPDSWPNPARSHRIVKRYATF